MGGRRRDFGSVRKLQSGKYQASYWHEGRRHVAPRTFTAKATASAYLATVEADIRRGGWIDPDKGQVSLCSYTTDWLAGRSDLRPTTRSKYTYLLDRHILPALGHVTLSGLTPTRVRAWYQALAQTHPPTAAGAYRLLATICNTAVNDEVIMRSPCKVKGAGVEKAKERPVATVEEMEVAVAGCPERYRLAVLLATWCQLRRGEILGLQRRDFDELHGSLAISRTWTLKLNGEAVLGPPKTDAGIRDLVVPPNVLPAFREHLQHFTAPNPDAWLFPGEGGNPVMPRTLNWAWSRARRAAGRPDLRFHDLRHTGLTWAGAEGATLAELMYRAGHKSPVAAMRYQQATKDRDRVLAEALGQLASRTPVATLADHSRTNRAHRSAEGAEGRAVITEMRP